MTYQGADQVYANPENFARIYIDSVEKTTISTSNTGTRGDSVGQTFSIGNRSDLVRGYDGLMDDLFIWNRVLTQIEMNSFRNGNIPGQYIFGLEMNEASGAVVNKIPNEATFTATNVTQNTTSYTRSA